PGLGDRALRDHERAQHARGGGGAATGEESATPVIDRPCSAHLRHPSWITGGGAYPASSRAIIRRPRRSLGEPRDFAKGGRVDQSRPSFSFAASDILHESHGGSNTISTFASVTPGTDRTLRSTSPGNSCAAKQAGDVSVIRTETTASGVTVTP